MIGGDHHHVVVTHRGFDLGQARIEVFERFRVAFGVAAVTVEHVEIDEVREDQSACGIFFSALIV